MKSAVGQGGLANGEGLGCAGRLQLLAEFISNLKLSTPGRVIADMEGEKIVISKTEEDNK